MGEVRKREVSRFLRSEGTRSMVRRRRRGIDISSVEAV